MEDKQKEILVRKFKEEDYMVGKLAYIGYCSETGGKSLISGEVLPRWEELNTKIQDAWVRAGIMAVEYASS